MSIAGKPVHEYFCLIKQIIDQLIKTVNMDRKSFLKNAGAAMLAVTLPFKNNYAFAPEDEPLDHCIPTTTDILGPYYRSGAPYRTDLRLPGDSTSLLRYKGIITDEHCNPLTNAIADVWQADTDAAYDTTSADFNYRGKFQTSADGYYEFNSVKPGWYLNGPQYRPAHIHFRVTCPGFTELITQLYFEGDPYIADDPWASDPDAEMRIVPLSTEDTTLVATFNIILKSNSTSIKEQSLASPVQVFPNPFKDTIEFKGTLMEGIEILTISGKLIARAYDIHKEDYRLSLKHIGPGIYYCRVLTTKGIFVHRLVKL